MPSSRQVTQLPKPSPVLRGRGPWGLPDPPAGPSRPPSTIPAPGPSCLCSGGGALGSGLRRVAPREGLPAGQTLARVPGAPVRLLRPRPQTFPLGLTVTPTSSAPAFLSFKTFAETVPYEGTTTVPLSNMAFTWDVAFSPPTRCLQAGTSAPLPRRQPHSPEGCGRSLGKTDPGTRLAEPSG